MIQTGPRSEITNGCEIGAPNRVCMEKNRLDLDLVIWKDIWLENTDGPELDYGLRILVKDFEWTPVR